MASDITEYQAVILAASLHDIGKLFQRVSRKKEVRERHSPISYQYAKKATHEEIGAEYISREFVDLIKRMWNIPEQQIGGWGHYQFLSELVKNHSRPRTPRGESFAELIVNQADSYSSRERGPKGQLEKDRTKRGPSNPLYSIFSRIHLGKRRGSQDWSYDLGMLDTLRSFPKERKIKLEEDEVADLVEDFRKELEGMESIEKVDFWKFFNSVCAILEKYLWCLPGDTVGKEADVSLFDHLRLSSAIAACLYKYHEENNTLINVPGEDNPAKIKDDHAPKFLLVGGDLSGIQNYLYQIASVTGEGGVAKRLRARSFYLSILVEVTIQKILHELQLPITCNLLSAGGKFLLLVPNTTKTTDKLKSLAREIDCWFWKEFSGELSLNLSWKVALSGIDFHQGNFTDRLVELEDDLQAKKNRKLEETLMNNETWNEDTFRLKERYDSYGKGVGDCNSCKKFPRENPDPDEEKHRKGEDLEAIFCSMCYLDKVMGRLLLDTEYVAIGYDDNQKMLKAQKRRARYEQNTRFFYNNTYYATLLTDSKEWEEYDRQGIDYLVFQRIRDRRDEPQQIAIGTVNRFLANWVSRFEFFDGNSEHCRKCQEYKPDQHRKNLCEHAQYIEREMQEESAQSRSFLYSFSCIASTSSRFLETDKETGQADVVGEQLLGYLKADVDRLSLIFRLGLDDKLTASRYLTLSRMLDLFFSGWMYRIMKEHRNQSEMSPEKDFSKIYTVYSGGDDVFVVGPWETVIEFALFLQDQFKAFTCQNSKNISLSAAILVAKPRYPIARAYEDVTRMLEENSKSQDKGQLTLFGTTLTWENFQKHKLKEFADFLHRELNRDDSPVSLSFIHRLLRYHEMYQEAHQEQNANPRGLLYRSKLAYDIERNLLKKERTPDGKILIANDYLKQELLKLFDDRYGIQHGLMSSLKIPISICLYKNRKEKGEKGV